MVHLATIEWLNEINLFSDIYDSIFPEIIGYSESWEPEYMELTKFETDMVISEKNEGTIISSVIFESSRLML